MTERNLPTARLRPRRLITWVWLVPVIAAFTVLWLGWQSLATRGPLITISFDDAEGLDAGHTPVRYKSVQVGEVETVSLSKDLGKVLVTARMDRNVAPSLTAHAEFWVVKPRFTATGVSGLSTLVSGSYIEMEPGSGAAAQHFVGLEQPPVVQTQVPGTQFTLEASQLGSIDQGSPIYFRGIQVGEVLGDHLRPDGAAVDIYVFVSRPFDRLVRPNSHFWNASGVSIGTSGSGFKANIGSLQTLLAGGIDFDSPDVGPQPSPISSQARFKLFDDQSSAEDAPYGPVVRYEAVFSGVVHGLSVGAPVDLQGLMIGHVTAVTLQYDLAKASLSTPVQFDLEPDAVKLVGGQGASPVEFDQALRRMIATGLRARLASGSLLTGSLLVSLESDPSAGPASMTTDNGLTVIPSASSSNLDQLMRSATTLIDTVQAPLPKIMGHLSSIVANLDHVASSPQLGQAAGNLARTLANLQRITNSANVNLPPLLASLRQTADAATRAADAANRVAGGNPAADGRDLPTMMRELTAAARSIRDLADFLDQHPDALLRGRKVEE